MRYASGCRPRWAARASARSCVLAAAVLIGILRIQPAMSDEIRFRGPFGIAVTADGAFYVSEIQGRRVAKFSRTGDFVGELKHIEGYGELRGPFDVAVGKSGNLYIADTRGHSVLVLDTADNLTLRLGDGEPAAAPGAFHEPHFVDVNEALQRIVVADTLNNRVQVFAPN